MKRLRIYIRTFFAKITLTSDDIAKRVAEAEGWPASKRESFARRMDELYSEYFAE